MNRFNLSAWAIAHRSIVYFLMLAIVVVGIASYMRLGAQRGSHLHHQDDGGAGAMAGRDAGGHAASGHRADRAQAAGDASPRLPEELHQGGAIDGLRVSQGIDRPKRRCRIPGTRFARRCTTSS